MNAPRRLLAFALLAVSAAASLPPDRLVLDNGIRVVFRRDPASAVTVLLVSIGGGQAAEPRESPGLSFLTTRLALDIPDQGVARDFVVKAVHTSLNVRGDFSVIQMECLSGVFDEAAGTLARLLADPIFTGVRVDRIREQMGHQRRQESDDAGAAARLAQAAAIFGGTGYGRSIYGTGSPSDPLKVRDAKAFYERWFAGPNLTLTVVSDLAPEAAAEILKKRFGSLRLAAAAPAVPAIVEASASDPKAVEIEKDALQSYVSVAYPLPPTGRRAYVLNALVENALGRGPGTRLWPLRSERKLAYNVGAAAIQNRGAGFLEAFLETDPAKASAAREALGSEMAALREKGLSAEELDVAKAGLKTLFLRGNESKLARASTLASFEALGLGADFFEGFAAEADAVGLEEINAHLRAVLDPARAHWVVVGPKAQARSPRP